MASGTASTTSSLPSGVSPPLALNDATQRGALIAISAAIALSLVLVSFPIRIWVRLRARSYKFDDYAFLAASIFSCLQAAAVFKALNEGFGKSEELIPAQNIIPILKALYSSDLLYIITLFLSKSCTALLFLRLTPGKGHFIAVWGTLILLVVWVLSSVLILAFRCHPAHPWTDTLSSSECPNLFLKWQIVAALDIISELALFTISIYLVWSLQMVLSCKVIVVGAFACRLPLIPLSALHLSTLHQTITSANPTLSGSTPSALVSYEIGYSILASIVPCLKPFMAAYEGPALNTSNDVSHKNSYKLSDLSSSSTLRGYGGGGGADRRREENREGRRIGGGGLLNTGGVDGNRNDNQIVIAGVAPEEMKRLKLRPENGTEYIARINTGAFPGDRERESERGRRGSSFDSGDSRRMIIKKNVEWSVDYRKDSDASLKEDGGSSAEELR